MIGASAGATGGAGRAGRAALVLDVEVGGHDAGSFHVGPGHEPIAELAKRTYSAEGVKARPTYLGLCVFFLYAQPSGFGIWYLPPKASASVHSSRE